MVKINWNSAPKYPFPTKKILFENSNWIEEKGRGMCVIIIIEYFVKLDRWRWLLFNVSRLIESTKIWERSVPI